ncbi:MAG: hypothetical protein P8J66_05735 [Verrucomicrobiota bacterium]|nr:hypothetical protein [Verrucomicrobiota bacterium]
MKRIGILTAGGMFMLARCIHLFMIAAISSSFYLVESIFSLSLLMPSDMLIWNIRKIQPLSPAAC